MTIDNKTQYTLGYEPEIRWNSLLMPLEKYNVTIIAVSYGYTTNYPTYGTKESVPSFNPITTTRCKFIFISSISDLSILGREMFHRCTLFKKKIDLKIKYTNNLTKEH